MCIEVQKNERNTVMLSVVVPVYNVEKYLQRCIESIITQNYPVDEIICVDDGSTDNSLKILQEYAMENPKIKIIHKKNGGLVSARKKGLLNAKGKYITYVDSDDWIEKNMYEDMMSMAREYEPDIITSGCIRDYGEYQAIEDEFILKGVYEGNKLEQEVKKKMIATDVFFRSNISIHIWNKLFKRDILIKYQNQVDDCISTFEDAACVYPCVLNAKKIIVMGKNYYHYCCTRNNSIMSKSSTNENSNLVSEYLLNEFNKVKIDNINLQYQFVKKYFLLLRKIESVVYLENEMLIPFGKMPYGSKVIIYGAGRFGVELKKIVEKVGKWKIVAWTDQNAREGVVSSNNIVTMNYDYILIAVLINEVIEKIEKDLEKKGISKDKILKINPLLFSELIK